MAHGGYDPGQQEAVDKSKTRKDEEDAGAFERPDTPTQEAPYA
jgi:hypothetical protein